MRLDVLSESSARQRIHMKKKSNFIFFERYFVLFFRENIRLDVSSESSARQRIHMKNQILFSSKNKSKN